MALTKIGTDSIKDDAVTTDKLANAINTERTANTAKDLTALSASNLTSGTIPDARFPATLPAASAANLTSVPAANITGTLPAISGANLTGIVSPGKAHNLVINGAMQIAQRGDQTGVGQGNTYTLDRWEFFGQSTSAEYTITQSTDAPNGFGKSLKLDCTTVDSSLDANTENTLFTKLEGQNLQSIAKGTSAAKTLTLSFYVKTNKTGTYCVHLKDGDNNRDVSGSYTVSDTNWNRYTITFPADTTGAFDNDNNKSLDVKWFLCCGSNRNTGSLNTAWRSNINTGSAPGQVNLADSTSNEWSITGVQLELGSVATDFEHRSYSDELLRCYRYYYAHKGMLWGITSASDHLDLNLTFPVPMRTTPSRTQVDTSLLFKNRLDQENSTSATTYSYSGVVSPTGDFWVARPGSGDAWGVSYTSTDTHAVYYHVHEGTTSYAWSAEL